jgi:hypothetical protein
VFCGDVGKMVLNREVTAVSYSGHNMKGSPPPSIGLGIAGASTRSFVLNVCRLTLVLVKLGVVADDDDEMCREGYVEYDAEILPCSKAGIEVVSADNVVADA